MTLLWLLCWLVSGRPSAAPWSAWFVFLLLAVVADIRGGSYRL